MNAILLQETCQHATRYALSLWLAGALAFIAAGAAAGVASLARLAQQRSRP